MPMVRCSATLDLVNLKNGMLLHNETVHKKWYAKNVSQCHWREIKWAGYNDHFNFIGKWTLLQNGRSSVVCEFKEVQCLFKVEKIVYQTFYTQIIRKPAVEKNLKTSKITTEEFNVLLLGIDGVSHSRMIRQMPRNCRKRGEYFDRLPIVWKDYAERGYATQKAEEWADVGMFNSLKKGFQKQPVQYYMRPIFKELAKVHDTWRSRCLAYRHEAEFLLDYVQEFV